MATKKKTLPKAQSIGQTGPKFKTSIPSQTKRYPAPDNSNPFETARALRSTNVGPINTTGPRENVKKKGGSVKSKLKKK